jgi:tRNA dimethylallyltransferase
MAIKIICVIGPTASGKSARAVALAQERGGEVISVDSRQIYKGLDIGTEKISKEEMGGIPHHLIDIKDASERYSASDFALDAERLIREIVARGKVPILAGGTHFYFDALLNGIPEETPENGALRKELEQLSTEEIAARVAEADPRRYAELDPRNRRRLVRALEIIEAHGKVPARASSRADYEVEWVVLDIDPKELREKIDARLRRAFEAGLIEEVARVRKEVDDERLNELGLEYKIVGEYLRGEREESTLLPTLSAKLWQYSRRQRAWVRKLTQ